MYSIDEVVSSSDVSQPLLISFFDLLLFLDGSAVELLVGLLDFRLAFVRLEF